MMMENSNQKNNRIDYEGFIIACVFIDSTLYRQCKLDAKDFVRYRDQWIEIGDAMKERGSIEITHPFSFDPVAFVDPLGPDFPSPNPHRFHDYCSHIRDMRILRELEGVTDILRIQEISQNTYERVVIDQKQEVLDEFFETYSDVSERYDSDGYIGIQTGFSWIDSSVVLDRRDLVTLAARPGCGKSSFALSMALRASFNGHKVLYVTLEMGEYEVNLRAFSNVFSVPLNLLVRGRVGDVGKRMDEFATKTENLDVKYIRNCTTKDIHSIADAYDLVIVDQVSNLRDEMLRGETKASYIGRITRDLKATAMEKETAIIACAQINRAGADEPTLLHLKDSGSYEEDSDVVLIVHQEKSTDSTKVKCEKNRRGESGHMTEDIVFDRKYTRFRENTSLRKIGEL